MDQNLEVTFKSILSTHKQLTTLKEQVHIHVVFLGTSKVTTHVVLLVIILVTLLVIILVTILVVEVIIVITETLHVLGLLITHVITHVLPVPERQQDFLQGQVF